MARVPVLAGGGIVLRQAAPPLIAVVRLRKRNEWVLPKGKLDDGETPRNAAEREVTEETGHDVTVHEFLGTLVYESGGRSKVVHYWRMEAGGEQAHELMGDVREVDWLPLYAAVERLSRSYERAFLENVGPLAVEAAVANPSRPKINATPVKRRRARPMKPAWPPLAEPAPELEPPIDSPEPMPGNPEAAPLVEADPPEPARAGTAGASQDRRKGLAGLLREWLRRVA
jgi:8-oxo-dGTP diphosphatase